MKKVLFIFIIAFFAFYQTGKANLPSKSKDIQPLKDNSTYIYDGLQDDQSLDNWMILGPIPVFNENPKSPDQASQKKVFYTESVPPQKICSSVKDGKL